MNRFNIAQKMQVARDLLYEAYTASYRNDITDHQFRHFVGKDLPRIINHLQKVQLLLKHDESKQPQPPISQTPMLGEVPHVVNDQPGENSKAVVGETPVVGQNEQTEKLCIHPVSTFYNSCSLYATDFCYKECAYSNAKRQAASAPDL